MLRLGGVVSFAGVGGVGAFLMVCFVICGCGG